VSPAASASAADDSTDAIIAGGGGENMRPPGRQRAHLPARTPNNRRRRALPDSLSLGSATPRIVTSSQVTCRARAPMTSPIS